MPAPRWARDEIAALDPLTDSRRITELSFEVRVGSPMLIHAMFSLAFARQVAVPEIAQILHRDGRGLIMRNPRMRNDETLRRFGELISFGVDGSDAIARIQRAHSPYPITNDLNLYTLATLACEPRRVARRFLGRDYFSAAEVTAHFAFWRHIGQALQIDGIPDDPDAFMAFYLDFEKRRYQHTFAGAAVTKSLADEFASRWFPPRAAGLARQVFFSIFDEKLRRTHGVPRPAAWVQASVRTAIGGYLTTRQLGPDGRQRRIIESFRANASSGKHSSL